MPFHAPEESWQICYAQLAPRLLLYARQWCAALADAEDVVQTAFVKFWRLHPTAQPEHYPLLYATVRTTALDLLRRDERRARREAHPFVEIPIAEATLFEADLERKEEAALIEAALQKLPAEQREVLVLRIWGELTFAQIAELAGESINTIAARHRYALAALRKMLSAHSDATSPFRPADHQPSTPQIRS